MVLAKAKPLLELPEAFKKQKEEHMANLFSDNDIDRKKAVNWLSQNADPQILSRIGKEVLRHDNLPIQVRMDIHKLLMNSCFDNIRGLGKLPNEHCQYVMVALRRTHVKARRC